MLNFWCITWPVGFKRLTTKKSLIKVTSINLLWPMILPCGTGGGVPFSYIIRRTSVLLQHYGRWPTILPHLEFLIRLLLAFAFRRIQQQNFLLISAVMRGMNCVHVHTLTHARTTVIIFPWMSFFKQSGLFRLSIRHTELHCQNCVNFSHTFIVLHCIHHASCLIT